MQEEKVGSSLKKPLVEGGPPRAHDGAERVPKQRKGFLTHNRKA